jgi:hypothetical protein
MPESHTALTAIRVAFGAVALQSALSVTFLLATVAGAQEPPDPTSDQRIEALEEQVKELKGKVEDTHRGMTADQLEQFYRRSSAGNVANYTAERYRGKALELVVDEGWWGVKNKPLEFRVSGWAQVALFHDFQGNSETFKQIFSSGAITVPTLKVPQTGFDAGGSRVYFEGRAVFPGRQKRRYFPGVTHFLIDIDLGGGALGLGYQLPRVREFFVQHGNLTIGQALTTFANGGTYPGWLDRGAPGAFTGAGRQPLARYAAALSKREDDSTHVVTASIEGAFSSFTNANSVFISPNFVVRYDYTPTWGNLMGAAIVRYLVAESTVTANQRASQWVAAGTLTGWATIPTKRKDHLKWGFVVGPGSAGLMFDNEIAGMADGVYDDATNSLSTMMAWGAYGVWERPWADRWNSSFVLAYVDVVNIASQPTDALNNTITATVTLTYEPWNNVLVGVEYFYGRRMNFDRQTGFDNRLNLVFRLVFNRDS